MNAYSPTFDLEPSASCNTREALIHEVRRGLSIRPRSLSPWMFYDSCGSRLFERITELPEYYLTRTERDILSSCGAAIIVASQVDSAKCLRLIELGAGTASKTAALLDAIARQQDEVFYVPIDVSPDALDIARDRITALLPEVRVQPLVANYVTHPPRLERFEATSLAIYLGSSIGNFSPEEARAILQNLRSLLQSSDALLLGTDLVKERSILLAAYDDGEGVTAEFNLNILRRLNRDLGADFDPANFRHLALWNSNSSRIEMHLKSVLDQHVRIPPAGLSLCFQAGETIHTENSYKFTREAICILLEDAGFVVERIWTDAREWYAVTLARVP